MRAPATGKRETEADFQTAIWDLLLHHNYFPWHDQDSKRNDPGFLDIWAGHVEHGLLVLELKSEHGRLMRCQEWWLTILRDANLRAYVVRPSQFDALSTIIANEYWTDEAISLYMTGGYRPRLTDAELLLGPHNIALRYNEIKTRKRRKSA